MPISTNPASMDGGVLGTHWEITPAWSEILSSVARGERVVAGGLAESLTEDLFYLDEPWQGRFLELVANLATSWKWHEQRPTRDEIAAWLGDDLSLYQYVRLLLRAWWRPRRQ